MEKVEKQALTHKGSPQSEQTQQEQQQEVRGGTGTMRIRILVVDDHDVVRKGMCTILAEEDDFEVVG